MRTRFWLKRVRINTRRRELPLKKQSDLSRLMGYAGKYRAFTYASWVLSALSALLALVPFLYIWMILRDILDEATASLDVENETHIQTALSRLIKNKTVLIIAHRMRTVAGADKIVVLSDGVVAEQGSLSELYAQNGIYTHMADLQTQGQNWTI